MKTIELDPAIYQQKTNDYLCKLCGWQGYPDVSGGWCQMDRIPCPECHGMVEETIYDLEDRRPDLSLYF